LTNSRRASIAAACLLPLLTTACAAGRSVAIEFAGAAEPVTIDGFSSCAASHPRSIEIDPDQPLAVFVHGCNASAGRFRALAEVFEAHGQQTICFEYDDRESLDETSARLAAGLEQLERHQRDPAITVFGHSQGGLVVRRAFISEREDGVKPDDERAYRIVTVSSPFNGIAASAHCGMVPLHLLTFGVTAGICAAIAGDKWNEIHERADFMRAPGTLIEPVDEYVKIVTDERETCRRYGDEGECEEDDFVFSVAEQYNEVIDADPRVENLEIRAGHVEIVGDEDLAPLKLIELLQQAQVLVETPPEKRAEIAALLRRLF
jgi:pimeloyl-ACP methyl ester carboxylesterase